MEKVNSSFVVDKIATTTCYENSLDIFLLSDLLYIQNVLSPTVITYIVQQTDTRTNDRHSC